MNYGVVREEEKSRERRDDRWANDNNNNNNNNNNMNAMTTTIKKSSIMTPSEKVGSIAENVRHERDDGEDDRKKGRRNV